MSRTAVSYLRVSSRGQVDGDGLIRQAEKIKAFAAANGFTIDSEYRDAGVSGTNELANRPGLASLLETVETQSIKFVLIERADRLARDLLVCEVILAEFRQRGVQVLECEGGNDLTVSGDDNPTAKLIRQILAAVSEFDKNCIVAKLRIARQRKRGRGERCEGRKPFGSLPGESETVDRIKALHRKPRGGTRLSFYRIAAILNAESIPTRTGKPWAAATVRGIVLR